MDAMDMWDFRHETEKNFAGAVVENKFLLLTEQSWVDVQVADGSTIRVHGDGKVSVLNLV